VPRQLAAMRQVNRELVSLYADIGRMIASRQEGETWGKSVVASLTWDLQSEFPGAAGFSAANLWRMKLFHETHGADGKLAPLVREIAWSHNVVILEKCKDPAEREFYIRATQHFGWTRNVLVHQIENRTYHKTLLNQTNFSEILPAEIQDQARLAVKDGYTSASWSFPPRIRNGNWSGRSPLTWKNSCARWAGCSLLSAASTGYQSAGAITSWICCCTTAACAPWSPSN
jgi:predicted nuclease of restriction endonuclease-like (RecB) superfamily